jgi:aminoglycoside 6'-N-acetyltransferase I
MNGLMLRQVGVEDVQALAELYCECFNAPPWNDGWSLEAAYERLAALSSVSHFRGYVALLDGSAVGMLLGQKERWVTGYHFCVHEMCVRTSMQRSGIGALLLRRAFDELRGEGVDKVYLITAPGDAAEAFYAKHGFYNSQSRIVMALALEAAGVNEG